MRTPWTREAIKALGPVTNARTAFSIFGVGERLGYESIQRGEWPTRVLRLGSRIIIPTHDLLVLLYGAPENSVAAPATGAATAHVQEDTTNDESTAPPRAAR
jgi:hypothetical protein